jgi:hypothetical protein
MIGGSFFIGRNDKLLPWTHSILYEPLWKGFNCTINWFDFLSHWDFSPNERLQGRTRVCHRPSPVVRSTENNYSQNEFVTRSCSQLQRSDANLKSHPICQKTGHHKTITSRFLPEFGEFCHEFNVTLILSHKLIWSSPRCGSGPPVFDETINTTKKPTSDRTFGPDNISSQLHFLVSDMEQVAISLFLSLPSVAHGNHTQYEQHSAVILRMFPNAK